MIADNYYKLRDNTYSAWDESMLKSYLDKNRVAYEKDAKKSDLASLVKDTCEPSLSLSLELSFRSRTLRR